jgi:hypothetical protein
MATLDLASFERGTVVEWAMEGHAIAQTLAYRVPKGRHLDSNYVQRAVQESDLALIKAGVRLAAVLNRALVAYQPSGDGANKADNTFRRRLSPADVHGSPARSPASSSSSAPGAHRQRVRVHGLIRLYHGQPEIVIQEPSEVVPLE